LLRRQLLLQPRGAGLPEFFHSLNPLGERRREAHSGFIRWLDGRSAKACRDDRILLLKGKVIHRRTLKSMPG
jgi:hypothetical protein